MEVLNLDDVQGRRYPAGRMTRNLIGGVSPIQAAGFCLGHVMLDPRGGQVPWHNHPQEEVYVIVEGAAELCVGEERGEVRAGQTVFIPAGVFHQLTNLSPDPMRFFYVYSPIGDVEHWRQELDGSLPRAGIEAPPLPEGAAPQITGRP